MIRKSFFANTIEAAFAKATQELGEDALLIESRRVTSANRHLGAFEVVVTGPAPEAPASAVVEKPNAGSSGTLVPRTAQKPVEAPAAELKDLLSEVSSLRRQLSKMAGALNHTLTPPNPLLEVLIEKMIASGVAPETASQWAHQAERAAGPEGSIEEALRSELMARWPRAATPDGNIVAVVGPAGAGKTTALVKIAFELGVQRGRAVRFLSLDEARIGAAEQLRACAAILGGLFQMTQPRELPQAVLASHNADTLMLIDTPGLSAGENSLREEIGAALQLVPGVQTHLVLTATRRSADLSSAMQKWQCSNPQRLLFTHMDEASSHGHLLSFAIDTGVPVSYCSWGRQIPEDLERAAPEKLIELTLGEGGMARVAAA